MSLIKLEDSTQDVIVKMSKGNPGAAMALVSLISKHPMGLMLALLLDTYGIYGSDIYVLLNDICGGDIHKMAKVLQATQHGKFSSAVLKDACSRQDYSGRALVPVDQLCAA